MSAIIFFADIADPIISEVDADDCLGNWLPMDRNLLAVQTTSLRTLLSTYDNSSFLDGKLGEDAYWHCEYLFGEVVNLDMPEGKRDVRQSVGNKPSRYRPPFHLLEKHPHGALIFRPDSGLLDRIKALFHDDE